MNDNERSARELVQLMKSAGMEAKAKGGGVHWKVLMGSDTGRSLAISCFWYEPHVSALMMGMNPVNSRSELRSKRGPTKSGAEYFVSLAELGLHSANGRTPNPDQVVACAKAWLASSDLGAVRSQAPFVDQHWLRMLSVAATLDPALRWEVAHEPMFDTWVYGDGRSCRLRRTSAGLDCFFYVGQVQVAGISDVQDAAGATSAWLLKNVALGELCDEVPEAILEPHSEALLQDPIGWHWMHVAERIADPGDVLAGLKELIEVLAQSPIATQFYTYSSLTRLCFSSSSHYPWVDEGLPIVERGGDGSYWITRQGVLPFEERVDGSFWSKSEGPLDLETAIEGIEASLSKAPVRPFFGEANQHEITDFAAEFERTGSALRPELVQHEQWSRIKVFQETQSRSCDLSTSSVVLFGAEGKLRVDFKDWPNIEGAVRVACRFLEEGATLDEIEADPGVESGGVQLLDASPARWRAERSWG